MTQTDATLTHIEGLLSEIEILFLAKELHLQGLIDEVNYNRFLKESNKLIYDRIDEKINANTNYSSHNEESE